MLIDLSLPVRTNIPLSVMEEKTPAAVRAADLIAQGHVGTHVDRLLGSEIPLEFSRPRALCFDVRPWSDTREIVREDLPLTLLQPGDAVLFHTGAMARHGYGSAAYLAHPLVLSWEVINELLQRKVRFIGVDAGGLRPGEDHRAVDEHCERGGAYVIENLRQLEDVPVGTAFTLQVAWFDAGGTGLPCRVVAEVA
ncbi:MAG: cyclase family protein [Desulfovibrio sp.]|nr:cyclase family protein [Desulfovibrio sp.]MCA1985187.1 cyclase family protein [Desulfovibrio sp.]